MRPIIPPAQSDNQFADGYGRWGVIGLFIVRLSESFKFLKNSYRTLLITDPKEYRTVYRKYGKEMLDYYRGFLKGGQEVGLDRI